MSRGKRFLNFTAAAFLSLSSLFALSPNVGAAEEAKEQETTTPAIWLQISPVSNKINLVAGEENDYSFTVKNIGSEPFSYHVYAAPYSVTDEDYNIDFSKETNRTQISRWIKFYDESGNLSDKAEFTIDKGEMQTIGYKVSVPADIPEGGQYATIFAESNETEGDVSGSGIKTVSRVGLIVYGHTDDGKTKDIAEISEINIPTFMTSGKISASSLVKNTGNTDFETTYSFEVKSLFGKQLFTKENTYNVLPETSRRVKTEWEETPMIGFYRVHYKISALNGETTEEVDRIVLILPVWAMIIAIILLTLIVIWIIILIRKRKERKSRLLV